MNHARRLCLTTLCTLGILWTGPASAGQSASAASTQATAPQVTLDKRTQKKLKDLRHRNAERRAEAAEWMGLREVPEAVPELTTLLTDGDDDVRNQASRALWRIGPPAATSATDALKQTLRSEQSGQVRINIAGALWKLDVPTQEIRPLLKRGLEDHRDWTRVRTATLLHRMGHPLEELLPIYQDALSEGSVKLRQRVMRDVLEFDEKSDDLIPLAMLSLGDSDDTVQILGILILQVLEADSPEVVAEIRVATRSRSEAVRDAAVDALAALPESNRTLGREGDLLKAMQDNSAPVRASAAEGLGALPAQSPDAVRTLIAALSDSDDDVRAAAADALGELGEIAQSAVPHLQALWDNRKLFFTIRHAAGRSLDKLGQPVDWQSES